MEGLISSLKYVLEVGPEFIALTVGVLTALIALFMIIPGEEPEATLQAVVNFLTKFSRK